LQMPERHGRAGPCAGHGAAGQSHDEDHRGCLERPRLPVDVPGSG
jgi:hypothetical protein